MATDPDIADMVDLPALRRLLEDFPETDAIASEAALPYFTKLPIGMTAGRFIAYTKGRNDI